MTPQQFITKWPLLPQVRPTQLAGNEINPYAQELAQVVVWIGFLQWKHHNGFTTPRNPVLEPADSRRWRSTARDWAQQPYLAELQPHR